MRVLRNSITLSLLLYFGADLMAQKSIPTGYQPIDIIDLALKQAELSKSSTNGIIPLSAQFNAKKLPFFCKMEHQLESTTRFPVRIRLGDVRYVNKLESKD